MSVYEGKFIVEGRHYEWLPGEWNKSPEFGPRKQTIPTLDLRHITVVQQAPTTTDTYIELRKVHRQAWTVSWTENAPMDLFMRDHLETLYTLQKEFWIQFDDEMTREGAILETIGTEYKAYFTPTFPIMPYGSIPSAPTNYNGTVYVNGTAQYTGFTVDSEIGMVRFNSALTSSDIVQMAYSWKARVRIEQCDIRPGFGLARHMYVGNLMFMQTRPDYENDLFPITTGVTTDDDIYVAANHTNNSYNNITWGDSRYSS